MLTEPPAAQHWRDEGVEGVFSRGENTSYICLHPNDGCGYCVQVRESYTWTINWTGERTQSLRTKRGGADSTFCGGFGQPMSAVPCSTSPWQPVLSSLLPCAWGIKVSSIEANRINRLTRKAGSVLWEEHDYLVVVSARRKLCKLRHIMDKDSHPLCCCSVQIQDRLLQQTDTTTMYHRTPQEILSPCGNPTEQLNFPKPKEGQLRPGNRTVNITCTSDWLCTYIAFCNSHSSLWHLVC